MPDRTEKPSRTGEYERVESEPRLEREPKPKRPITLPELEIPKEIGSSTGIMRIRREADDETSKGDEDNPL